MSKRTTTKLNKYAFRWYTCKESFYTKGYLELFIGTWSHYAENGSYYKTPDSEDAKRFMDYLGALVLANGGDDRTYRAIGSRESRVTLQWQSGTDSHSDMQERPETWGPEAWYGMGVNEVGDLSANCMKLLKIAYDIRGGDYGSQHPQFFMNALMEKGFAPLKRLHFGQYRDEMVYYHDFSVLKAAPTYEQRLEREKLEAEAEQRRQEREAAELIAEGFDDHRPLEMDEQHLVLAQ